MEPYTHARLRMAGTLDRYSTYLVQVSHRPHVRLMHQLPRYSQVCMQWGEPRHGTFATSQESEAQNALSMQGAEASKLRKRPPKPPAAGKLPPQGQPQPCKRVAGCDQPLHVLSVPPYSAWCSNIIRQALSFAPVQHCVAWDLTLRSNILIHIQVLNSQLPFRCSSENPVPPRPALRHVPVPQQPDGTSWQLCEVTLGLPFACKHDLS